MERGVREDAAEFWRDDVFAGPRRFRRLADTGPVYEVVEVGPARLKVRWIDRDDIFELPRAEAEFDAVA